MQPGEQPRSLVCNECGKKFRSQAQAEFHASKSEHVDFQESTEEIAPLTQEEKDSKLQNMREKLAAKRATQSEQDKADQKRNEVRRIGIPITGLKSWSKGTNFHDRRFGRRTPKRARTYKKTFKEKQTQRKPPRRERKNWTTLKRRSALELRSKRTRKLVDGRPSLSGHNERVRHRLSNRQPNRRLLLPPQNRPLPIQKPA